MAGLSGTIKARLRGFTLPGKGRQARLNGIAGGVSPLMPGYRKV